MLILAKGKNPKVLSERLGHASITLTLNTYSHVPPTFNARQRVYLKTFCLRMAPQLEYDPHTTKITACATSAENPQIMVLA